MERALTSRSFKGRRLDFGPINSQLVNHIRLDHTVNGPETLMQKRKVVISAFANPQKSTKSARFEKLFASLE